MRYIILALASVVVAACASQTQERADLIKVHGATGWLDTYVGQARVSYGSAILLDSSTVLTAAHVVEGKPTDAKLYFILGAQNIPVEVIWEGKKDTLDVAVLRVKNADNKESAGRKIFEICDADSEVGRPVALVTPTLSTSALTIPRDREEYSDIETLVVDRITVGANGGHSGSGIFDIRTGCLAGIVSRKDGEDLKGGERNLLIERRLTKFAPASAIRKALDNATSQARTNSAQKPAG